MSDIDPSEGYTERTHEEVANLAKTWTQAPIRNQYVAPPAPGFDTHGVWQCFNSGSRSGYTAHAIALGWGLEHLGIPAQLVPHPALAVDIDRFPADRNELLLEWHKNAVGHPHLMFVSFPPDVAAEAANMGPPQIPYCAFEGDRVSNFARDLCNGEAFRRVWVVSPFVRDAMEAGGVLPERIAVVQPILYGGPWDTEWFFNPHVGPNPIDPSPDDPFTFGAMGTWHSRKGFGDLIRAYWAAFNRADPVQLVIRCSAFGKDARLTIPEFNDLVQSQVARIAEEFGDFGFPQSRAQARIKVITGTDATDEEIVRWLGSLDCYANASYGEGLGIPQVWAKAQGVPMVSSDYGAVGQMLHRLTLNGSTDDEVFEHQLVPVDPEMVPLNLMFDRNSRWGGYQIGDLTAALTMQFERGRRVDVVGAEMVRDHFGVKRAGTWLRETLCDDLDESELDLFGL